MFKIILLILTLSSSNFLACTLNPHIDTKEEFSYHRQIDINQSSLIKATTFQQDIIPPYDYQDEEFSYLDEPYYAIENSEMSYVNDLDLGETLNQYRGENVRVAVIDTGYNYLHEEFSYLDENNQRQTLFSPLSACVDLYYDYSSDQYYLDILPVSEYGYEVIMEDTNPSSYSENNHGTSVVGTIFSQINGLGIFGLSPNVELIAIKLEHLYLDEIKYALEYLLEIGDVDIVSISLGAYAESFVTSVDGHTYEVNGSPEIATLLDDVITRCYQNDMFILAAAGNDNTSHISYPAGNNYVYSVGALEEGNSSLRASYSNYGNVDIYASGTVISPIGFYDYPQLDPNSSYGKISGTSFACPLLASIAALYKSKYPYAKPNQIAEALNLTATDLGVDGHDDIYGYGRVSIANLMDFVPLKTVTSNKNILLELDSEPFMLNLELYPSNASNQDFVIFNNGPDNILDFTNNTITPLRVGDFAYEYRYLNHAPLKGTENEVSDFCVKISGQVLENLDDVILNSFNETFPFNRELNLNDFFFAYQNDYYDIPLASNIYFNQVKTDFMPSKDIFLSYLGRDFSYHLKVSLDNLSLDDFPLATIAYLTYFDEVTHQECLNHYDNFREEIWQELKSLYAELVSKNPQFSDDVINAMSDDLLARYHLIINKYHYDDFLDIGLETSLINRPLTNDINSDFIVLIVVSVLLISVVAIFLVIYRNKGHQEE